MKHTAIITSNTKLPKDWTDGYFVCSVGNVSEEMLRKYIEKEAGIRRK